MENNSSLGVPRNNARCAVCSYNTYSHLTSLSRDGHVYFTVGLTNTHAVCSDACWLFCASVFPCTNNSRHLPFSGRYDHDTRRLPVCSKHKEIALPRQGKCANPSQTLRAILFSYRENSKDTLSNRKLDKHKKYLHLYFNNLSYSSY